MWQSKNLNIGDRFIPLRAGENFEATSYCMVSNDLNIMDILPSKTPRYTNYACQYFAQESYRERLWKLILPKPKKILNFTKTVSEVERLYDRPWPGIPRNMPLISAPLTILDMPGLDTNLCHNIIDWGKKGHVASTYNGEMHIWHQLQSKPLQTETNHQVMHCVKWNCAGTQLALAVDHSAVFIIDGSTTKILSRKTCCRKKTCIVTSLEWSAKCNILITGCTNGTLTAWFCFERALVRVHKGPIIAIRLSIDEKYVASSGLDNYIRIWAFPEFLHILEINSFLPVKAFAWHPWRESLLMCSHGKRNNGIALWNVDTAQEKHWFILEKDTSIDAMTFNKKTGELVVSIFDGKKTIIAVYYNLSGCRDAIIWHLGRVPYLLWNHNHTQLLTAGSDEYLCIWNFFGKNKKNIPQEYKKKKKYSTNPLKNLILFGQCIR